MKASSKVSLEVVLSNNWLLRTTDGMGNVNIYAEGGIKSETIKSALSEFGIEFISEYTRKNEKEIMFRVKIDDLKKDCPSLCEKLEVMEQNARLCLQYMTENNLSDRYVIV